MVEVYNATQMPMPPAYPTGNGTKRHNTAALTQPPLGVPRPIQSPPGNTRANPKDPDAKAKQAAQQFEAVFINQLLQQLDKTIDRSDSLLNGGHAEETFRGMMWQEMATRMATKPGGSGFGLSDTIYRQIKLQQDQADASQKTGAASAVPTNTPVLPAMPASLPVMPSGNAPSYTLTGDPYAAH